jgi:uroporphyrinogen decarboxylase
MTPRENLLSLYRRNGFDSAPVHFHLCPELEQTFSRNYPDQGSYDEVFEFPMRVITDPGFPWIAETPGFVPARTWDYGLYYDPPIADGARMDIWGIAHEPGGEDAHHMTRMRNPLAGLDSLEQLQDYPWPDFALADWSYLDAEIAAIQAQGLAAQVWMECTIWETAWYMRRMDLIMTEMAMEDPKAVFLLDKITDLACLRAEKYAAAGADIIAIGDDIGMQETIMMSKDMYADWLKPRLKRVIDAARAAKPDVIIQYHSCGHVTELIPALIETGIDVLNPLQPECMEVTEIFSEYKDSIAFNGSIGTQTTMPFATPQEVKDTVKRNLDAVGESGGLLCCPTHMLEPEVPWANIEAYVEACREYK